MDEFELQRRIKDAVSGAQPDSARLWENVMNESTHARNVRNAKRTAIALTVLALAIAVPVSIALLSSDDPGLVGPGGTESPSPSPSPPSPIAVVAPLYVDTQLNVTFYVPSGWGVTEFEGHRTVGPRDLPLPPQDGDTAVLQTTFGDLAPQDGRESATFAGYPAERVDGVRQEWYVVDWPVSPLCTMCEPGPITVWWEASTEALWQQHQRDFETITSDLRPLFSGPNTIEFRIFNELVTRRGSVASTFSPGGAGGARVGEVELTPALATAIDFLDRRMWLDDLTPVLSEEGQRAYDELTLEPASDEKRLEPIEWSPRDYRIVSSEAADANSYEIVAEVSYVRYSDGGDETATFTERMFVGPGTSVDGEQRENVIRGVVNESSEVGAYEAPSVVDS